MFDISNPQKRERLLVILAGIVLLFVVVWQLPAQFTVISGLKRERDNLEEKIEEHNRLAGNIPEIQTRLAVFERQALASAGSPQGSESVDGYRAWLINLATGAGLTFISSTAPTATTPARGSAGFTQHSFSITCEGQLARIAEFLRQFHRVEYLHFIQQFQPSPVPNQPGRFRVTFQVRVLSLPQVRLVNMPNTEGIAITPEERQMRTAIENRAILSEYTPPRPMNVVEVTADSVNLSWTDVEDADSHDIRYKLRTAPNVDESWTTVGFTGATGTISGLTPATAYEFQIRTVSNGDPDAWSVSINATTERPAEPPEIFLDAGFCYLDAVMEVVEPDGRRRVQCWINHRTIGRMYFLFEGGSLMVEGTRCIIRGIDMDNQRVLVEIGGGLYSLRVGQNFDQLVSVPAE